eukprot:TRINITY_DN62_c0_g1_i14.p1 TRINITY_DN62_c0_g1~~TRINITY_DN62_c0_g1_i14.p1  ORF type:complete len:197 (+),score=36.31 TRINITY_DN62_c0_g1_i14:395-985(+)
MWLGFAGPSTEGVLMFLEGQFARDVLAMHTHAPLNAAAAAMVSSIYITCASLDRRHDRHSVPRSLRVLKWQRELAERDGGPPTDNVTDKGFRLEPEADEAGGQTMTTPCFRRKDSKQLNPTEAMYSTTVGRDRAIYERAVRLPGLFRFMDKLRVTGNNILTNVMFKNIVFRCNFVYAPLSRSLLAQWEQDFELKLT